MSSAPPRRFKVEPIETSVRSSKDQPKDQPKEQSKEQPKDQVESSKPPRRFAPEPIETTIKTHRRFEPEPIETTKKTVRRFAPEPVETTVRKSREKFAKEWASQTEETPKPKAKENRPPRKFAPQLIGTAKRSRKAGDPGPAASLSVKTNSLSGKDKSSVPPPPENTPTVDVTHNPLFLEIQRATSPLNRRRPMPRASQHSFRVPQLDPIESSESEPSSPPSPTTSPSIVSDNSYMYKDATRVRESVDDRVSGYLLELAARAAEKQLREQVMAAFANDDFHEPVDHFIDHELDDAGSYSSEPKERRESSANAVNWEFVAMQQHREKLEKQQEAERIKKEKWEAAMNKPAKGAYNPFGNNISIFDSPTPRGAFESPKKDPEINCMRKSARPPMLGKDIKFPRCPSPEPARFDTTQGCDALRLSMCYLNEQSQMAEKGEGLWCGSGSAKHPTKGPSLWSNGSSRPPSRNGLWGGFCVNSGQTPPRGPTGILTPKVEIGNPLETPCPTPAMSLLPPTPPASNADFACIDEKLAVEQTITEEYSDDFVTQVYNYLSLGYPSMARPFDPELSRISKIPVSELRQDDHLATSRGYIRLGADGNLKDAEITEESCVRWRALRIYIKEWARQHPNMTENITGGVGTSARRGSWAL